MSGTATSRLGEPHPWDLLLLLCTVRDIKTDDDTLFTLTADQKMAKTTGIAIAFFSAALSFYIRHYFKPGIAVAALGSIAAALCLRKSIQYGEQIKHISSKLDLFLSAAKKAHEVASSEIVQRMNQQKSSINVNKEGALEIFKQHFYNDYFENRPTLQKVLIAGEMPIQEKHSWWSSLGNSKDKFAALSKINIDSLPLRSEELCKRLHQTKTAACAFLTPDALVNVYFVGDGPDKKALTIKAAPFPDLTLLT